MAYRHIHRAITAKSEDRSWTACITPEECAAYPTRQNAHGNIVRVDWCDCGARRLTEINQHWHNQGPWMGAEE
jgi:hypothetical protein